LHISVDKHTLKIIPITTTCYQEATFIIKITLPGFQRTQYSQLETWLAKVHTRSVDNYNNIVNK